MRAIDDARRIVATIDRFRDDPAGFHRHVLGRPPLHPKQAAIARALVGHRVVVVPGAHSVGKSWAAASLVLWYLFTRRPSKIVATSPSWSQLVGVLWESVRAAYLRSRLPLGDARRLGAESLRLGPEHYAVALSTNEPERLQGHHGPDVMVITDESSLIKDPILDALESLGYDRLLMLGNPIRSRCGFRRYYDRARAGTPGFAAVHLTAWDSPHAHLTDEEIRARGLPRGLTSRTWIDGVRVMYGEGSPYWKTRVEAEFPDADDLQVFPEAWLDRCGDPGIRPEGLGRSRWIAADVAGGTGRDRSAAIARDEAQVLEARASAAWGPAELAGQVAELRALYRVPAERIVYDATGIGAGLDGHLALKGIVGAIPYRGGEGGGPEWTNTRTAATMNARARLNPHLANHRPFYIPPAALALLEPELLELRLFPDGDDPRRQRLEPKEELVRRLGRSPDIADAFAMSFLCGPDLPDAAGESDAAAEAAYADADAGEAEALTPDQLTLRMAGIL